MVLDLADPLTRHVERAADLLQGARTAAGEAEAHLDDLALTLGQRGQRLARRIEQPRIALSACQWLLTAGIAWTAWMLADSVPYWPINPSLTTNPWFIFQIDVLRCAWSILPATVLWGASSRGAPFTIKVIIVAGSGD